MSKLRTVLPTLLLVMIASVMLSACGMRETPRTVSDVSCATFRVISYSVASPAERAKPREQQRDDGNQHDSPETVAEVQAHNARFEAVCPRPLDP